MPITFLDEEEDIESIVPPPKRKVTFLDEEETDIQDVSIQATPSVTPYQYDKSRFRPKGATTLGAKPEVEEESVFRQALDIPVNIARGGVQGIKMMTDILGADNPISKSLSGVEGYMADLLSAQAKEDQAEISRIMQDAEDKGFGEQVKAGIKAFSIAPVDTLSQALGTMAPVLATGLAGSAAKLGALGIRAVQTGVGAGMGAGMTKGNIYSEVKDELVKAGIGEQEAEKAAVDAQSYGGKNLDQILLGAGLGAASTIGAESIITRMLTKQGTAPTAGMVSRVLKGGITEAIPETAQAAQEQLATNIALQREGLDVPTMRGVVSAGTMEGIAGAAMGGVAGGLERPSPIKEKTLTEENFEATNDIARKVAENGAPLTASVLQDKSSSILRQDELARQLDEQLEISQAAQPKFPTKEELVSLYSTIPEEQVDAQEASLTEELKTADTEEKRVSVQNALDAIKEVKSTRGAAPEAKPTKTGKLPTDVLPVETPGATYGREEGIYDVFAGVRRKPLEPTQPAAEAAQPTPTDATQEILQQEGVRQEPQDGTQVETEEAGVSGGLQPTARGEEEGQVIFGLRSVADNTATREQISALSEAGLVDIVKGKPVINEDGAAILAQPAAPAIVEQEPVTTPIPEEAVTPAPIAEAPVVSEEGAQVSEITPAPTIAEPAPVELVTPAVEEAPTAESLVPPVALENIKKNPDLYEAVRKDAVSGSRVVAYISNSVSSRNLPKGFSQSLIAQVKKQVGENPSISEIEDAIETQVEKTAYNKEKKKADEAILKSAQSRKGESYNLDVAIQGYADAIQNVDKVTKEAMALTPETRRQLRVSARNEAEVAKNKLIAELQKPITPAPVTEQAAPAEAPAPEVAPVSGVTEAAIPTTDRDELNTQAKQFITNIISNLGAGKPTTLEGRGSKITITKSSKPGIVFQKTRFDENNQPVADREFTREDARDIFNDQDIIDLVKLKIRPDILNGVEIETLNLPGVFTYQLKNREHGIGTTPKEGFVAAKGRNVAFNRPLTFKELKDFEINPIGAIVFDQPNAEANAAEYGITPAYIKEQTTPTPAVSETITEPAAAPTGIAVGNRVKLGKSPQTYTIEEVIPQSANDKKFGEQYYSVKNEKTGETQVVEKNDMKPVSSRRRKMASEPEPLPEGDRYGQVKLNKRIQRYFGGKIPDKVYVVDNTDNKEYQYKAAYYPDLGILVVNNAYVRKGENVGDIIAHELGHYAFGDKKFKEAFDNFYNSLSPEDKAKIDNIIEESYNKETEQSQIEERNVIAFTAYTIVNPQRRSLWNAVLDALKEFANKVFGKNFQMSDPNRTALAILSTAKKRFAAGEEIVREDTKAKRAAAQTQDARFAELEAKAKTGDKEAEAEAQRMVDEAAKEAGYNIGPVWHGSPDFVGNEFDLNMRGRRGLSRGGFSFTRDKNAAETYMQTGVDPSQKMVDEANALMRELQSRINSGLEWSGPYNEDTAPEFRSDAVDNIDDFQGYIGEIASMLPNDLRVVANEIATRQSPENFSPNPRLIRAFIKNPKVIDVSGRELLLAESPTQIKSADPFTYDDAGNLIPLSERFQPTTPDIRRMAVEAEPRTEQVAGRTDRGTPVITTPVGIIKQTNEVLRKNFFDGTTVSDETTKKAWEYIERLLDIESGNANELAGQINDLVDVETNSDSRMGASLFSVSLTNYAANLAAQGDSRMLSYLVRRVNRMPVDKYAGGRSDAGRALRAAREYDIDGYGALKVEQDAKRDRTTAEIFATANPTEQQVKDVSDAIDAADNATIGTPEEVASDVEKIEKRTKRNITKKLETLLKKGSLKEMIASIKNTPLEEQQAPGWIEKVIKGYLEQAGLTGDAATTAAKLYDSILSERFVEAKQKAFEETLGRSAPWNNYLSRNSRMAKDSLKKIQVAIRTGVLDPSQTIESVIAKENGWDGFTKEQFERIVQLDNIINNPDNDDVTRREAMSDLNKIIVDAKLPVRFKDALGAYYVGNALMGIPTVTVNIASPIGFTVRNMMTDIGKYAFTDPARIPIAFESFLDSMRSWYDQTSYAFKNQIYLNDVVEYLQGQNVLRELFDKGKKQWANGEYAAGFVNMAVGMTQITGRVLSSLDQGAIAMLENQNITRYAMEALAANTKGRVPKDKLKEFANMVLHTKRRVIAESIASGMPRDRAGVLADLAVKSEVISALSSEGVNPMDVLDASINDALLSVGRNKAITIKGAEKENTNLSDEGMLSYLPISFLQTIASGAARQGSGMQIFSKMLYGFALVPARVFHNVAWFSPYGFIRLGVDKYKKSKGQDSPYAMSLQTDAQFKQRLTEAIAGSIVMLGLAALRAGSSDDEDDRQFRIVITGNGPSATTDRQYYDSWNKKWKPYSIHIVVGDTIIPINIGRGGEALFFPIMLAGAMDDWEIKKKQNDTKKEPEDLSAMASMLGSSFFALAQRGPYAAFTKPLFDASKDGRVTEELASQAGYFGKTFIPFLGTSVARNITDFINDPVDRSSVEGAIYANTPIVGPWMGAKALNALGQPVRADDWGDRLFKLGVPVVFSFPKDTPMNELNELILKQGSGPTFPTRTNAQKRFGDILTDKEFETYVREYGKVMSDRMFKNRTKLERMKPSDYDDELEKYARGYSAGDFKVKGASDMAVQAVKRMRQ